MARPDQNGRRAALRLIAAAGLVAGCGPAVAVGQGAPMKTLPFSALDGWRDDDHQAGLRAFLAGCGSVRPGLGVTERDWAQACAGGADAAATSRAAARAFLETRFAPVALSGAPLFTGYYEPEIDAALAPDDRFRFPLHALPGGPAPSRAEIAAGALDGAGLEIAWLDDAAEHYFLHIQGSGRLRLPGGRRLRVRYAGRNGRDYVSIGKIARDEGLIPRSQLTAEGMKTWMRANPGAARRLTDRNPSYIFFQLAPELEHAPGPVGALGVPLTPLRSAAVDPAHVPLGAPVWIETQASFGPIRRLFAAQDVGSAIKGPQRADLFFGGGADAGRVAGEMAGAGRMVLLLPRTALRRLGLEG
ncbi:murein transglycosylase A [Rhodovulum sp. DZ06]|uniref:murein transglycosylase A n=1 Tax=Rhodovulum sp. DZ06 TaxID=3425126 RepID=UPI003D345E11